MKTKKWIMMIDMYLQFINDGFEDIGQFFIVLFLYFFRKICNLIKKSYFLFNFIKYKVYVSYIHNTLITRTIVITIKRRRRQLNWSISFSVNCIIPSNIGLIIKREKMVCQVNNSLKKYYGRSVILVHLTVISLLGSLSKYPLRSITGS